MVAQIRWSRQRSPATAISGSSSSPACGGSALALSSTAQVIASATGPSRGSTRAVSATVATPLTRASRVSRVSVVTIGPLSVCSPSQTSARRGRFSPISCGTSQVDPYPAPAAL